jgi:competence protein ComEC
MICGGAATFAGLLFRPLGAALGWIAYLPLAWTIRVVEETARFPHASIPFPLSDGGLIAAYALIIGLTVLVTLEPDRRRALWERLRPRVPAAVALSGLILLNLTAWLAIMQLPDGKLHVTFLDVGQGDAILIETPTGAQILIDGGPDGSILLSELGRQIPFWDRSLDLVVLTHPDADHLTGLIAALERYDVGVVMTGAQLAQTGLVDAWETALQAQAASRVQGETGMRLEFSDDVALEILHPDSDWSAEEQENINNQSLVLRLTYQDVAVLLPGDIEADVERVLLRSDAYLASTVLKLPHHGSKTSSSRAFLDAVNPQLSVISVGAENDFGHPSGEVLERLEGMLVYRTDRHGRVEITSDGHTLWIETER